MGCVQSLVHAGSLALKISCDAVMVRDKKPARKTNFSNGRDKPAFTIHALFPHRSGICCGQAVNILLPALLRGTVRRNEFAPRILDRRQGGPHFILAS